MQPSEQITIVNAFAREWTFFSSTKLVLNLKSSTFNLFCDPPNIEVQTFKDIQVIPENTRYDLILGDIPIGLIGLNQVTQNNEIKPLNTQKKWLQILNSLPFLKENGSALFLLEPIGFSSSQGIKFEKTLNKNGFFVNAYINCPEKILLPETVITPILVVLSREQKNQLFVAELLNESQAKDVVKNYFLNINNPDSISGKYIDSEDYYGFHRIKAKEQIERLESQYKTYKECRLNDLVVTKDNKLQINCVSKGGQFKDCDNAIYGFIRV